MAGEKSPRFLETSCDLLREGYPIRFCATGQSMKPTIRDGETIIIEPVEAEKIQRGDIILYRTRRGVIAHRVANTQWDDNGQPRFILRGDSAASYDQPIAASDILGRVTAVERRGRLINLSGNQAKRWSMIRVFLYKLRLRLAAIFKLFL
jgi:signal peptidase I